MDRRRLLCSLGAGFAATTAGCSSLLRTPPYEADAAWITPTVDVNFMLTSSHLVVARENALRGVALETGEFTWERTPVSYPMAVADDVGVLYGESSASSDVDVVAVDLGSGETRWEYSFTSASTDHQAVNQEVFVYLVEERKNQRYTVVTRSFADGSVHSQSEPIDTGGVPLSIRPCRDPNYVFLRTHGNREIVSAFDVNAGTVEWGRWVPPEHDPGDASSRLEDLLVYEKDSYVAGLDEGSGTVEWTLEIPHVEATRRDTAFAPTGSDESTGIRALDLPTGSVRWRVDDGRWGAPLPWRADTYMAAEHTRSGGFAVAVVDAAEGVSRRPYEYDGSQVGTERSIHLLGTTSDALLGMDHRVSTSEANLFALPLPDG